MAPCNLVRLAAMDRHITPEALLARHDPSPTTVDASDSLAALGKQLLAAWALETAFADASQTEELDDDTEYASAQERCSALADLIAATPATTLAGLGAKAIAHAWAMNGGLRVEEAISDDDAGATDARVKASVFRDVLQMAGVEISP